MVKQRALLLLGVALAFAGGFYRAAQWPQPSAFLAPPPPAPGSAPPLYQTRFASSRLHAQTHASSLIELGNGRIRAFWFSGSREGARDVAIHSAVYDPANSQWGPEQTVVNRIDTERGVLRYVAKLGNPVPVRAADGSLWLYYVTVSVGGWAGSSLTAIHSSNDGSTWSRPRRLITSPFFNVSTLVRNGAVRYQDGSVALPVYNEFTRKFGELLRFGKHGELLDKQRIAPGNSATLQPVLLVQDAQHADALMRYAGPPPHRVIAIATQDGGRHWSAPEKTILSNPDSAVSAIVLADGRWLAVLNDVQEGRDVLSLMISADRGKTWQTVKRLEDEHGRPNDVASFMKRAAVLLAASDPKFAQAGPALQKAYLDSVQHASCSATSCRSEFSYPFLIQAANGDFDLTYTWNRVFIKHVRFTPAWLAQQLEHAR